MIQEKGSVYEHLPLPAKQVLSLLSDSDRLHIIAISDKVTRFREDHRSEDCERENGLFPASMDNKVRFYKFIDQLNKTKGESIGLSLHRYLC